MPTIDSASVGRSSLLGDDSSETRAAKTGKKELSPDDFIKLFLTQLRNQNPMQPMDSSAILQQMSQISSISSANAMQKTMRELENHVDIALGKSELLQATQMIGKHVAVPSEVSPLTKEEGLSGSVLLEKPASDVKVTIKDSAGNLIKTIDLGASTSTGLMDFKWDGVDNDGHEMKPDYYHISATATVEGKEYPMQTVGSFKVSSVASNQNTGKVILNVDGLGGMTMDDVIKVLS